jgi:hypothetical protein
VCSNGSGVLCSQGESCALIREMFYTCTCRPGSSSSPAP